MILILIFAEVLGEYSVLEKHLLLHANHVREPRSLRIDRRSSHELPLESLLLNEERLVALGQWTVSPFALRGNW